MSIVFLATEFTDPRHPELLSLGIVTLDGREHYTELDLSTHIGQALRKASNTAEILEGVFAMWGLVPGAVATSLGMGRQAGEWLLRLAGESSGARIEVAFDYTIDFELMECAIRSSDLWDRVREIVIPVDVGPLIGTSEAESAAEGCYRELRRRKLARHHALADAHALRAAYIAVKAVAVQMAHAIHSATFHELARHAVQHGLDEGWLSTLLRAPAFGLRGRRPVDLLDEPGGLGALKDFAVRIAHGAYS
jgi:uncharacterized protein (DUF2384 family)